MARGNAAVQVDNLRDEYVRGAAGTGEAPFRVGDRVRTKGYDGTHWDGVGVVTGEYDGICVLAIINGREGGFAPHELAPAILQIEAGKCYRTRDGRKVGPMRKWDNHVEHPWDAPNAQELWRNDGTTGYGQDLIAEWVDEPQPAATTDASNDNAPAPEPAPTPAQPKFKVGDRVLDVDADNTAPATVIDVDLDGNVRVRWRYEDGTEHDGSVFWNPSGFHHAPSPTTGFTIPIPDDDSAVSLRLELDTGALHEELDSIIAKLRTIDDMACDLGIRFSATTLAA